MKSLKAAGTGQLYQKRASGYIQGWQIAVFCYIFSVEFLCGSSNNGTVGVGKKGVLGCEMLPYLPAMFTEA